MTQTDFLIVGQGIAGTLLAHELTKRSQSVIVVDNGEKNASLTSAGMVNPVVLKRFAPVWQAREQILCARETMAQLATQLQTTIDYQFDMFRIFHNEQEKQTWTKKVATPELATLLDATFHASPSDNLNAPLGVGRIHFGGRMDLHALLTPYRDFLRDSGRLHETQCDYKDLVATNTGGQSGWQYNDIKSRYVVFCEGYGLKNNPYFNHLPLDGNKGEVLTLRIPDLNLSVAVKSSVFIMPLPEQGEDVYFIGATYNWTNKDTRPTEVAKAELLDKLHKILPDDIFAGIEVLDHRAGMRPTVSDRRPLLGAHRDCDNLFVLNGLGTHGVMLGATMAQHLVARILDDVPLPDEVDIARFKNVT